MTTNPIFKVTTTENRRVFEYMGVLMGDFDGVPNRRDKGKKHRKEAKYKRERQDEDMDDYILSVQGLIRCSECDQPFHQSLAQCPYCGAPRSRLMP